MTTQELVERLEEIAIKRDLTASFHSNPSLINEERETASKTLRAAASRLSEMDAEIKRLREALREIAKQVPAKDMDEDYYEAADFEDGYDRCVFAARAALTQEKQT